MLNILATGGLSPKKVWQTTLTTSEIAAVTKKTISAGRKGALFSRRDRMQTAAMLSATMTK